MTQEPIQVRLARLDFKAAIYRDAAWNPVVNAEFAAEQGPRVLLVDVRERAELTGTLGFIPVAVHLPLAEVTALRKLGLHTRVVLVSTDGRRAAVAARLLELAGMDCVAALDGGLLAWRAAGLISAHNPDCIQDTLPEDPDAPLLPSAQPVGALTLAQVQAHVSDWPRVRWLKLAAFQLNGRTACVDGRDSQGVVGTPGGDLGEIALALATAEACGVSLDRPVVSALLRSWIDAFGRIYYHSDIHALNHLILGMRADPDIPEAALPARDAPPTAWRRFQASPPPEIRERLLEHLSHPANIGCGHLRLALQHGEHYGVRPALITEVLRAFYMALWEGLPELELVVLGGGHQESAVLLVRMEGRILPYTRIPLVPPAIGGVQMFVYHPQVSDCQRESIAHWLSNQPVLPALQGREAEVHAQMIRLAEQQMAQTLGHLAPGLPIYQATFAGEDEVSVQQIGVVGA